MSPRVRHVVGCMTGTSLDGLDCVLTRITGEGLDMKAEYVGMISRPFDEMLRGMLLKLASGEPAPPIDYMRAARMLGVMHADAIAQLLKSQASSLTPDFIVAHGQTIWHAPQDTLSWQLFDPWPIVRHLGVPVCYDLRQADLIAGGQGAPITPIADWVMYREKADAVINLGGIANSTILHLNGLDIEARDEGPCNLLIDGICRRATGHAYDRDGEYSKDGKPGFDMVIELMGAIAEARKDQRSLGREIFDERWVEACWSMIQQAVREANNQLATCVYAVACSCIGLVSEWDVNRVVLAGGGARNPTLLKAIRWYGVDLFPHLKLLVSDDLGIPCEAREAMGFAVLGALSQDGVPITLPRVTGADDPGIAGAWVYPK